MCDVDTPTNGTQLRRQRSSASKRAKVQPDDDADEPELEQEHDDNEDVDEEDENDNDDDDNDDDSNDDKYGNDNAASNGGTNTKKRKNASSNSNTPSTRDHKGLRHFSILVCEKLAYLQMSTYKEIADQLVAEAQLQKVETYVGYDEKNIRRRIYDALNVLMAMDIITKERKQIKWKGFGNAVGMSTPSAPPSPSASTQHIESISQLRQAKMAQTNKFREKQTQLEELIYQYLALKTLLARNRSCSATHNPNHKVFHPFVLIGSEPDLNIRCEISPNCDLVNMSYSGQFVLHDDYQVLTQIGESLPDAAQKAHQIKQTVREEERRRSGESFHVAEEKLRPPEPVCKSEQQSSSDSPDASSFNVLITAAASSPPINRSGVYAHVMSGFEREMVPNELLHMLPDSSALRSMQSPAPSPTKQLTEQAHRTYSNISNSLSSDHTTRLYPPQITNSNSSSSTGSDAFKPFANHSFMSYSQSPSPPTNLFSAVMSSESNSPFPQSQESTITVKTEQVA